jgi:multidrug efflux pump subunit AcrA (membrane-fusion protein)
MRSTILAILTILTGVVPVLLAIVGCGGAQAEKPVDTSVVPAEDYQVRRADFVQNFLMTGELKSVRSDNILVPPSSSWNIQLRWMEVDGARVETGQRVVELDNTALLNEAEEKYLLVLDKHDELAQRKAELAGEGEDKVFTLEQKQVELDKAEIEAAVPEAILERREHQERQLQLQRARNERDKAQRDLEALRESTVSQLAVLELSLEKAERELQAAERAMETLVLRAPRDGLFVVAENFGEGRKFQVGDSAWTGLTVARIPDLSEMLVEAMLIDVDDGRVKIGDHAECTMDAYPELPLKCEIVSMTPIAQEAGRRSLRRVFRVVVELERTDPERMRPGMSVRVDVEAFRVPEALLAPRGGLDLEAEPQVAFLRGGGRAEVTIGACNALDCVVHDGLSEGDRLTPTLER